MDNQNENIQVESTQEVFEEKAVESVTAEPAAAKPKEKSKVKHTLRRIGASLLGFAQTLLSLVGVVAILWTAIGGIGDLIDTSDLHEEFYYFLEPVLVYSPDEFEDVNETEQDAFLNAAAFRVMQAEQIRMLREGDETPNYPVAEDGMRIAIDAKEITESYQTLFGKKAKFTHRSIEESSLEYSEADDCYYVPFETENSGYRSIVFSSKRTFSGYQVRVGFVPNLDIQLDEHGNEIPPTEDMAVHFQTYTLRKSGDSYYIVSCKNK